IVNSLEPYGTNFTNGLFVAGVPAPPTTPVDPVPVISVTASVPLTSDDPRSAPAQFTFTRTGDLSNTLAASYTLSGTASLFTDFTVQGGPSWAIGASTATMTITGADDGFLGEPDQTVVLTLQPNSTYTLGSPIQATVTIMDKDGPPPAAIGA